MSGLRDILCYVTQTLSGTMMAVKLFPSNLCPPTYKLPLHRITYSWSVILLSVIVPSITPSGIFVTRSDCAVPSGHSSDKDKAYTSVSIQGGNNTYIFDLVYKTVETWRDRTVSTCFLLLPTLVKSSDYQIVLSYIWINTLPACFFAATSSIFLLGTPHFWVIRAV